LAVLSARKRAAKMDFSLTEEQQLIIKTKSAHLAGLSLKAPSLL
jgi:hypothetical protein